MVKSKKSADAEKKFAARKKGGDDDSNSFDDGLAGSESGEETAAMAPDLSMESLRKVFHLPCVDAAVALGVAHSKLKRRCHKLKIARWPQRKLASLVFLRDALPNDPRLSASQREGIIAKIDAEYSKVMLDPNHPLDKELEQLRKSNYKLNYNRKLRCAAKSGKRAGSAGDTETAPSAGGCGSWQGAPDLAAAAGEARSRGGGARWDADGNGGGGRPPRGAPPPLTLGRGSVTSPAGSGQENGAAAATDSAVWDTAGDEEVGAAAAAVVGFNNSPRKVVHRRLAAQLGGSAGSGATGGGTGGGGGHPSLGRRSSLERAALLSVITDGKIVKTGAASRRQSGSGSGNATPRQLQSGGPSGSFGGGGGGGLMAGPGSPLAARRNLASPVGHNAGVGSCTSDLGFHDAAWGCSQNLAAGHLQLEQQQSQPQTQQPQQQPSLQRPPCGFPIGEETWFQQSSLRGSPHPSHALPDSALCGAPGAMDALFGGLGGGATFAAAAAAATAASQGRGPLPAPAAAPAGGSNSVMSAGVNAILNDTGAGGLLMGLEAMVAGVSGQRTLGPDQLSEEELALLGIQGADRDLLLDPSADNGLDPLLDLLLAGGDALTGAGAAVTGLNRQSLQQQQQQQYAMSVNPSNDVLLSTQQQQQLYSQLDSHRFSSTLVHQQPHPPAPVPNLFASAALGPARRLSDAMPAADGLFASGGGGGGGGVTIVSSLPRTSASGLSLTTSGYGGGGGFSSGALGGLGGCIGSGSHSAPLRQHRLSSVSGVSSGMGQRPSRFAGGLDLSMNTLQPLEFNHHRNFVGSCADGSVGNGGGGGVLMGSMLCDDRYSALCGASDAANGASHSGPMPQLTSRYGAGDTAASAVAITGGLGRRRDFPPGALSNHHQQLSQHANLHPHQHVLNAFEGRHSAPGQFCIPGWDESPAIAHSGGNGSGNAAVGVDPTTLTGRMLLSTVGPMQQAAESDLPRFLGTGTATTAAAANAVVATAAVQRLAAALGSDWPLDARLGIGGGGAADSSGSDIARRMAAAHIRSNSTSGLVERDGFPGALSGGAIPAAAAAAAACSRPSTGSGYNGAAASLSLLNRRDPQLTARDQLARTILDNSNDNASNNSGNSGGGGGGPAAVAAALGAQGLHMQPQSPLMPSLSDPAPGRGVAGHVSPPPDTIVSLQGLRLRGEDDRIAAGEQRALGSDLLFLRSHAAATAAAGGGGSIGGPGGGNDQLTSMLQELQYLKRQQQQQIQEQAQQIQRQQMQIARLGLLSRLAAYDDPYSLGDTTTTAAAAAAEVATVAGKQQQQGPSSLQSHGGLAAATAPRQQVQLPYDGNNSVGCDGDGGGGRRSSGLLEAVDLQLTDIDNFMELNVDLLRRNNSGFGSFMNEMRAPGLGGGSGGSFTLGGAGNGGGGAVSNDMEVMRQSLRKDLRQNSAEQWEEMLKQLAGGA